MGAARGPLKRDAPAGARAPGTTVPREPTPPSRRARADRMNAARNAPARPAAAAAERTGEGAKLRTQVPRLAVRPLTSARWDDLETLFRARGCSVARWCWCMYYRRSGPAAPVPAGASQAQANRAALRTLARGPRPPGLIAYRGATPVGWVALGPREDFRRLARSPVMKPVDDAPVWSVVCFVVPSAYRGQGVARALLRGAIAYARKSGAQVLEGYPVDRAPGASADAMWFGAKSMFDAAGFEEVARRRPTRPVVRLRPVA
ncbi:MAG: hypothetical protein BroJett026_01230 [Betaproteobacteria bacterium]|nr:MAG: hypothetical protein BroJett026_01230 [Betaproteobacteria bacterium]